MVHPDALTAASRFGLGPRPGDLAAIGDDPRGWVEAQLDATPATPDLDAMPHSSESIRAFARARMQGEDARKGVREDHRALYIRECQAWMQTAAASPAPFLERLVLFFANHFTVSTARVEVLGLAGAFVREALRPHVVGAFRDLLLASTRHPAMLVYLDNVRSIGPHSRAGQRSGRGLNENLAREVLELHTLGVDGGYTQDDVESFAAILTGWGVARGTRSPPDLEGTFFFEPRRHEPGDKKLLGETIQESGEMEGVLALAQLARHPSTARFVARKLARHFVADDPPPAAVDTLAQRFMDTEGDLREVARALVHLDAAWEIPLAKVRSPIDLVLAGARAFGWEKDGPAMVTSLEMLGQRLLAAPSPEGWPDTAAEWLGPDAMLSRLEWAELLAEQSHHRVEDMDPFAQAMLGPQVSGPTRRALDRADHPVDQLALIVASPEFQRR